MLTVAIVAGAWIVYGALHSLLAARRSKTVAMGRWGLSARAYRLAYNAVALLTLWPPLHLTRALAGPPLWQWTGPVEWVPALATLLVLVGFVASSRHYDMGEMIGLRAPAPGPPRLVLSPLHRHVRHPWYFLLLVLIWTRDTDLAWLATCVAVTVYVVVGSALEERRLEGEFGEPYARYRERVPGLVPIPGRHLSRAEARSLVDLTRAGD